MALHEVTPAQAPAAKDIGAFERSALRKAALAPATVPPRYHASYFRHIFGDDYSAGYYAYIWAEVLTRDTGERMHRHGGLTRANGEVLRDNILARGRTQEPRVLFRNFYGREPEVGPLLDYYGLAPAQRPAKKVKAKAKGWRRSRRSPGRRRSLSRGLITVVAASSSARRASPRRSG